MITDRVWRVLAVTWLMICVAACGHVGSVIFGPGLPVQTDLMALLPREDRDPVILQAKDAVAALVSQRIVVLVGHSRREAARAAAATIRDRMIGAGLISSLGDIPAPKALKQLGGAYYPHRSGLLSDGDRRALLTGRAEDIIDRVLSQVFGFGGLATGELLTNDTFLLFPAFLGGLPVPASRLTLEGEWPSAADDDGRTWMLITGRLSESPTALGFQSRFVATFDGTLAELQQSDPALTILRLGALFFAKAGAEQAMTEISLIGSVSLIGTALLIIMGFRAATPLVLGVTAILIGLVVALSACLLVFGELHIAAQLFGASLIGIAADYAILYFGQLFSSYVTPRERLAAVLPGITLGMATTVAGYGTLALSPFPGLVQVAAFSAIGLLASFLTVVLWFPLLDRTPAARLDPVSRRLTIGLWSFWSDDNKRRHRRAVLGIALLVGLAGATQIRCDDDVRHQQALSGQLLAEQAEVQRITGFGQAQQFFLVQAADTEQALVREEALGERLTAMVGDGALTGWSAPARFVPSAARQQADQALIRDTLIAPHSVRLRELLGIPSLPSPDFARASAPTPAPTPVPVTLPDIIATGALPLLDAMVLPALSGQVVHVVTLDGVGDVGRLRAAGDGLAGVRLIDPTADISALLAAYRQRAVALLAVSLGFMAALLALRYGLGGALFVMIPPVVATALTPMVLALVGLSFSFFSAMALVLVLSVGVDYAVFCAENRDGGGDVTLYAVALAMLTTVLSFGLMAVSTTVAVCSFGATMATGVIIAYFLSPMVGKVRRRTS